MTLLLPRVAAECPGKKQWYTCSKNNFRGCCSVDPCSSGICPDSDNTVQTTLSTLSTAKATVPSDRAPATGATSPIAGITTLPPTSSQGSITSSIASRSTAQTIVSSTDTPAAGSGDNHGALIGGVVGGILALLLLIALILLMVYRSRRKRGKQFTLLRWGPSAEKIGKGASTTGRDIGPAPRDISLDVPKSKPTSSRPAYIPQLLLPGPISSSTPPSNRPPSRAPNPYNLRIPSVRSSLTTHPSTPPSPGYSTPSIPSVSSLRPAPLNPHRADITPELSDTGFYRQRAELAAYSQSELINVPPERRRMPPRPDQDQDQDQDAGDGDGNGTQAHQPARPSIITPDGVVLCANFDRRLPRDDPYPRDRGAGDGQVLSFVNYPSRDSILPAYREEWRKSYESGKGV
ncbi:uncharacterized protein ACLA_035730 [Aspergillus clavatus NRRL 1]|uniref:Uncharacterized protein n=1 Tax=Aspergillus clavatus (strain ATCC 1007 / CBS 513.65 / DSM 816 / NCTC 3887 / NRRL 1 / QM 1276 / 107) TaxID=344612 RepID=A1CJP6_ASPCL|nr:uncharacterized protein ACLA_035730 [Aspergillus clavatus NRRL 1]EAW09370.1 conserved hypothetical protein [Aspergillus clavatus NRRL 1]